MAPGVQVPLHLTSAWATPCGRGGTLRLTVTAILRAMLDDPHSLQTAMEQHMRRTLHRLVSEAQKAGGDGVEFVRRPSGPPAPAPSGADEAAVRGAVGDKRGPGGFSGRWTRAQTAIPRPK